MKKLGRRSLLFSAFAAATLPTHKKRNKSDLRERKEKPFFVFFFLGTFVQLAREKERERERLFSFLFFTLCFFLFFSF